LATVEAALSQTVAAITDKMKLWEPIEESIYLTWSSINESKIKIQNKLFDNHVKSFENKSNQEMNQSKKKNFNIYVVNEESEPVKPETISNTYDNSYFNSRKHFSEKT
jgi:hypothetical protein